MAILITIGLMAGLGTYLSISPTFKIERILVKGNEQLTEGKSTRTWQDIKKGDNIFSEVGKVLEVKAETEWMHRRTQR